MKAVFEGDDVITSYSIHYTKLYDRLPGGRLWIHSPEQLDSALQAELSALGEVAHLISPNKLHHLFLAQWLEAYPSAISYAAPGLIGKRRDLRFDRELGEQAEEAWADRIGRNNFV